MPIIKSLKIPTCTALVTKVAISEVTNSFKGEQLRTTIKHKCGGCLCGRCPVPGRKFSFREEEKPKLIEEQDREDNKEEQVLVEHLQGAYPGHGGSLGGKNIPESKLATYQGPINYLPNLAVQNLQSQITLVKICFDASRAEGGGLSLNQILSKGFD